MHWLKAPDSPIQSRPKEHQLFCILTQRLITRKCVRGWQMQMETGSDKNDNCIGLEGVTEVEARCCLKYLIIDMEAGRCCLTLGECECHQKIGKTLKWNALMMHVCMRVCREEDEEVCRGGWEVPRRNGHFAPFVFGIRSTPPPPHRRRWSFHPCGCVFALWQGPMQKRSPLIPLHSTNLPSLHRSLILESVNLGFLMGLTSTSGICGCPHARNPPMLWEGEGPAVHKSRHVNLSPYGAPSTPCGGLHGTLPITSQTFSKMAPQKSLLSRLWQ